MRVLSVTIDGVAQPVPPKSAYEVSRTEGSGAWANLYDPDNPTVARRMHLEDP